MITNYVKNQGIKSYTQIHYEHPTLFDWPSVTEVPDTSPLAVGWFI
jgi:hypothetical protein